MRILAATAALAMVTTLAPAIATADADVAPTIAWQQCPSDTHLQCAMVPAPLDYAKPRGDKIQLRLVKRPADNPVRKIGTVFVNPGGPGGSAADFAAAAGDYLGARTRAQFDIVGIDPRGIGGQRNCLTDACGSEPVTCLPKDGDPTRPPFAFPRGEDQVNQRLAYDDYLRGLCAKTAGPIIDHMSTADTARDMDLIRRAVGDPKITYYGISYGSILGATYAAMYPNKIRALIVDAVLDPVAWTTGRGGDGQYILSSRLGSEYGAWEALYSAFAECDRVGASRCAAAGKANAKYHAITERLKQGPVETPDGAITYQQLQGSLLGGLYGAQVYPYIMIFIEELHRHIFGTSRDATKVAAAWQKLKKEGDRELTYSADPIDAGFSGVSCADSANPTDRQAPVRSAAHAEANGPGFGELWSWASSACVNWPGSGKSAFRGPWNVKTSTPLLITNPLHDPATPISGARALNGLMKGSTLLTLDGWGHGALGESACITSAYENYLVDRALPAAGTVCKPDAPLFPVA